MSKYENGTATRKIIIQAAKKLFLENGYEKTSFDDIALQAHVNRGSIYYHFKSKAALRDHIIEGVFERAGLAAQYIGTPTAYIYPLQNAICYDGMMRDGRMRNFILSSRNTPVFESVRDRYVIRIACFRPFLTEQELQALSHDFWTEYSLHTLDMNRFLYICRNPYTYPLEEIIHQLVDVTGKIYGVPLPAITQTQEAVSQQMQKIDFEHLNIRW